MTESSRTENTSARAATRSPTSASTARAPPPPGFHWGLDFCGIARATFIWHSWCHNAAVPASRAKDRTWGRQGSQSVWWRTRCAGRTPPASHPPSPYGCSRAVCGFCRSRRKPCQAAAPCTGSIDFEVVRRVSGLDEGVAIAALDAALRAELLVTVGEQAIAYDFTHALVRQMLYNALAPRFEHGCTARSQSAMEECTARESSTTRHRSQRTFIAAVISPVPSAVRCMRSPQPSRRMPPARMPIQYGGGRSCSTCFRRMTRDDEYLARLSSSSRLLVA